MGEMPIMAPAASEYAKNVDVLYWTLTALTVIFTVLVMAVLLFLVARYQRGNNVDRSNPVDHHNGLELAWSLPALVLGLGVFVWSAKLFAGSYQPPKNAKEIFVIGKQWMWHLQHANGIRENNELHIPVDEPVKFTMISQDVIHAFYVPEFRMQRQVQPGEYTQMWVTPTRVGKYHLYCNMYCGTQHSEMGGWVYVMSRADYDKWASSGGTRAVNPGGIEATRGGLSLPQQGKALYEKYQCAGCHGSSGSDAAKRGPSLAGIFGKSRQLVSGKVVTADDAYLRNAVLYPDEFPLAGWPQGMPSYKGVLSEGDVVAINAFIKTIGTKDEPHGGTPEQESIPASTDNQQFRYMYGGEQYQ
jgi:cytochrome c oxidase subunit II